MKHETNSIIYWMLPATFFWIFTATAVGWDHGPFSCCCSVVNGFQIIPIKFIKPSYDYVQQSSQFNPLRINDTKLFTVKKKKKKKGHSQDQNLLSIDDEISKTTSQQDKNDNNYDIDVNDPEIEYRKMIAKAQDAILAAEHARLQYLKKKSLTIPSKNGMLQDYSKNDKEIMLKDINSIDYTFPSISILANPKVREELEESESIISSSSLKNRRSFISYTDAETLEITLQPQNNVAASTLFTGAFALTWFSAIIPATFAARSIASTLFMVPFWIAGGAVAKSGVIDPLIKQKLSLGQYAWTITKEIAGKTIEKVDRPTEYIQNVELQLVDYINEVPRYTIVFKLSNGSHLKDYSFGIWMGPDNIQEATSLLEKINKQLQKFKLIKE